MYPCIQRETTHIHAHSHTACTYDDYTNVWKKRESERGIESWFLILHFPWNVHRQSQWIFFLAAILEEILAVKVCVGVCTHLHADT